MIEIGWFSAKLFFKGKLLRNPIYFIRQTAIGISVGTLILVSISQFDVPFCVPMGISSIISGAIMPFLLKDFKMK
jgi:hypothetical protein